MFKTFLTLIRGHAAAAGDNLAERNALLILDQQMRDASASLERAKRSLALAIAQNGQEGRRLDSVSAQIADLELRVGEALAAGREPLAREGAEAIARLEGERDAAMTARTLFGTEITRLKAHVAQAESRLSALDRGRRIARASEAVRGLKKGRVEAPVLAQGTLSEAEQTLQRLRDRQAEAQSAEDALDAIDAASGPANAAAKLAEAGFGPRLKTTADDVLSRIRAKTAA